MAYSDFDKIIGLLSGTEDPEHPQNAALIEQLAQPGSTASKLRDHIHLQTELLLHAPPDELRFDVEHGLAQALTSTRRHMGKTFPEVQHVPHATPDDVAAVVEALRMPPDALQTNAARESAVRASVANIQRQNPATRIVDEAAFNAAASEWMRAHVQSVDMLLRGK